MKSVGFASCTWATARLDVGRQPAADRNIAGLLPDCDFRSWRRDARVAPRALNLTGETGAARRRGPRHSPGRRSPGAIGATLPPPCAAPLEVGGLDRPAEVSEVLSYETRPLQPVDQVQSVQQLRSRSNGSAAAARLDHVCASRHARRCPARRWRATRSRRARAAVRPDAVPVEPAVAATSPCAACAALADAPTRRRQKPANAGSDSSGTQSAKSRNRSGSAR